MRILIFFALAALALLSPPAFAQTPANCAGDWYAAGYSDAEQNGSPESATSRVDQRAQRCGAPSNADRAGYEQGFDLGLRDFCTPQRAFAIARSGSRYSGWCPSDLAEAFAQGYRDGLSIHEAEDILQEARTTLRRLEWERRDVRRNLDAIEYQQRIAPNRSSAQNRTLSRNLYSQMAGVNPEQVMLDARARNRAAEENSEALREYLPLLETTVASMQQEMQHRYGDAGQ